VVGGVGGILLGAAIAAIAIISRNRGKQQENRYSGLQVSETIPVTPASPPGGVPIEPPEPSPTGPPGVDVPHDQVSEDATSLETWQSPERTSMSPDLRARWTGGTRYEPISPEDVGGEQHGPRRVATLEFRPRTDSEIPFQ
jgi:hypothetical protein